MTPIEAQIRIDQLRENIQTYDHAYYVEAKSLISDYDYDQLMKDLERLEEEYPQSKSKNSPTSRVSGEVTKEFPVVVHERKMLSLSNSYDKNDLELFYSSALKILLDIEPRKQLSLEKLEQEATNNGLVIDFIY